MPKLTWHVVLPLLVLIWGGALYVAYGMDQARNDRMRNTPCEQFGDVRARDLPARCLSHFKAP